MPNEGARSLERALVVHDFAGSYFLPRAIPSLDVNALGGCLAVASFDCSVTVVRLRHVAGVSTLHSHHDGRTRAALGVWEKMRARRQLPLNSESAEGKQQQAAPRIVAKMMWRHRLGPTIREEGIQKAFDVEQDHRVSSVAFLSNRIVLAGTYHGRVSVVRRGHATILKSDLALLHDAPITALATDGGTAVVASDNNVRLYDLAPRQPSVEMAAYLCEEGYAEELVGAYPHLVNCRDSGEKQSLLHIFAAIGRVDVLEVLLQAN